MNKTMIVVGGIVVVAVIAGVVFYATQNTSPVYNNNTTSTSTPSVSTDTSQAAIPGQIQQPGTPGVTTNAAAIPADTTVVVIGKVVPNGAPTSYWYEYGMTSSLGNKISNQVIGSGYASISAPGYITGLSKDTTYYFRLVAENQYGRVTGAQYSFQTTHGTPPPVGSVPKPITLAASGISRIDATLNGEVTPDRAATQYWFEYGKTANLGSVTPFVAAGNGTAKVSASQSLSNLDSGSTYYFRINAQNQFGTVNGAILTFKTLGPPAASAPSVTTRAATAISTSTATLRGTVNPNGTVTMYWFEYSTDSAFGATQSTDQNSAGTGISSIPVTANISGLSTSTTYYFRIVAQNNLGIVRGDGAKFKTK